jgi:hypothetical protein
MKNLLLGIIAINLTIISINMTLKSIEPVNAQSNIPVQKVMICDPNPMKEDCARVYNGYVWVNNH